MPFQNNDPDFTDDENELTVRPMDSSRHHDVDLVPGDNVGGATPTMLGGDSGGTWGSHRDLAHLAEAEPPNAPEVEAVHIREDLGRPRRR